MMKNISRFLLLLGVLIASYTADAQEKLAQTGFQFLSVGTTARGTALGDAFTAYSGTSEALFYNPAGLAGLPAVAEVALNRVNWIADITYHSGSLAFNWQKGKYGVLGLSFVKVDYGEFLWTRRAWTADEQDYVDITGWKEPWALMVGLGYARELSERFSVGAQVKYASQDLGTSFMPIYTESDTTISEKDYSLGVTAFDFGTIYKTGLKSLAFGMTVRNFAKEIKYEKEGFPLPLTFKIGISMNVLDFFPAMGEQHSLLISVDAVHPRSYPEYLNLGGEYTFMDMLSLRGGLISNHDEYNLTAGFGVRTLGLSLDYSYTPFDHFRDINRFSVKFAF